MPLSAPLSIYLDLLRVLAAFAVLFQHMDMDGISMSWLFLTHLSREGVIVFFVLSGYIIHATTVGRGRTARDYAVARLSRLYSVAIPAILLSVLTAWAIAASPGLDPASFSNWTGTTDGIALFSALLFLNESWSNPATLTMNHPYWSLCYEVWYYVLFGIALFGRGSARWVLLAVAGLIAGPAILLLFPVWLLGAGLSKYGGRIVLTKGIATLLFVGTLVGIGMMGMLDIGVTLREKVKTMVPGMWRLGSSQQFLTDYVLAVLVAVNILAFRFVAEGIRSAMLRIGRPVRYIAGFSFSLYLFHRPMTQLAGQMAPSDEGAVMHGLLVASCITALCLALSYLSERRVGHWRRGMEDLRSSFTGGRAAVAVR